MGVLRELRELGAAEVIDYRVPDKGDEYHVAVGCSGRNELARTADLMALGGRGGLRPRSVRTLGLAEAAEAHRQVVDRVRGRLVIHPWR